MRLQQIVNRKMMKRKLLQNFTFLQQKLINELENDNLNKMQQNQREIESSNNDINKKNLSHQNPVPQSKSQSTLTTNNNGFTNFPTLHQILPIIYVMLMLVQTMLIAITMKGSQSILSLCIIFMIIFLIVLIFWYLTTKIDPTDITQWLHKEAIKNKQPFDTQNFKYFCHICQTCVGKNSFHCRKCHRCVDVFDHHCKWLNNCIGAKNYFQFLALVFSTEFLIIFHIIINSLQISILALYTPNFSWIFYFCIFFLISDSIVIIANSILLAIHLYLVINKKTTLQLIQQRRKANKIHPSVWVTGQEKQKNSENFSSINQAIIEKTPKKKINEKKILVQIQRKVNKIPFKKQFSLKNKSRTVKVIKSVNQ